MSQQTYHDSRLDTSWDLKPGTCRLIYDAPTLATLARVTQRLSRELHETARDHPLFGLMHRGLQRAARERYRELAQSPAGD